MRTMGFSTGIALLLAGAVLVAPAGRALALAGLVAAAASAWPAEGRRRVIAVGAVAGVAEATVVVGGLIWWSNGHHISWPAIGGACGVIALMLLAYIAFKVRRIAARG